MPYGLLCLLQSQAKGMKRRLFNILSALSLVLCLTAGGLWVSNSKQRVWRMWTGKDSACFLVFSSGQIRLSEQGIIPVNPSLYGTVDCGTYGLLTITSLHMPHGSLGLMQVSIPFTPEHAFAGFEMTSNASPARSPTSTSNFRPPFSLQWRALAVPFWFCMLLTAVLPVVWVERKRRVCRCRAMGICLTCGYDLRASKDRCPECGTPLAAGAKA